MFYHMPPEFADAVGSEDLHSPTRHFGGRDADVVRRRHSSRSARSLSPPTDEDLATIAQEANRTVKPAVSSRTKDVEGDKRGKRDAEGDKKADGAAGDSGWCLEPAADWAQAAAAPPPACSALTVLIDPQRGQQGSPAQPGSAARQRVMHLKVFCPFVSVAPKVVSGKSSSRPVLCKVKVPEQSTVVDVIKATLRALREEPLPPGVAFSPNPDMYRLRVAEDDSGRPDEDLPVLDKKTALRRMGFDTLVLCALQPFRAGAGDAGAAARRPAVPLLLEDVAFRVSMGHLSHATGRRRVGRLLVPPDVLFKDALGMICERFKRDPAKYALRLLIDGQEKDSVADDPISLAERTLGTLSRRHGVTDLVLKAKSRDVERESDGSDTEAADQSRAQVFCDWDEASASRYTEYEVIKINKYQTIINQSRQERVLGIDRDKIYNMMRGFKEDKTKNPERNIADITYLRHHADRPCYFEIDYRPGVCTSGRDRIECASPHEAHEIVTKLRFLMDLARKGGAVPEAPKEEAHKHKTVTVPPQISRFLGGLGGLPSVGSPRGR